MHELCAELNVRIGKFRATCNDDDRQLAGILSAMGIILDTLLKIVAPAPAAPAELPAVSTDAPTAE